MNFLRTSTIKGLERASPYEFKYTHINDATADNKNQPIRSAWKVARCHVNVLISLG